MSGRAVVCLSGGLDSGVALGLWLARGGSVALAVFADYRQRAAEPEARASQALAQRFDVAWERIALPWLGDVAAAAGSALMRTGGDLPRATPEEPGGAESARAVWVPARNVVLVAAAAAFAEAAGAAVVLTGFNREEAATFADNSAEFTAAMTAALRLGTRGGVRVESPAQDLDKAEIVAAAQRLGLRAGDFWSCYDGGAVPCGRCESCARSERAWRSGG